MNTMDLENRTAIVTGGARGIGFAIAQRLLKSGAKVTLWDIDRAAMDVATMSLQASGPVYVDTVDVTDETSVANAAASHMRVFGKIDILVNNAGITGGNAPLWELAPEASNLCAMAKPMPRAPPVTIAVRFCRSMAFILISPARPRAGGDPVPGFPLARERADRMAMPLQPDDGSRTSPGPRL